MTDDKMNELVRETLLEINTCDFGTPGEGQVIIPCHWSRTGWAVGEPSGTCTCAPAFPVCLPKPLTTAK